MTEKLEQTNRRIQTGLPQTMMEIHERAISSTAKEVIQRMGLGYFRLTSWFPSTRQGTQHD